MTRYIQGKDGKFAGSIGDGKNAAPTPADLPRGFSAVKDTHPAPTDADSVYEAYMRHTRVNRQYAPNIPEPHLRGALSITHPADKPHRVENHRDNDVWFCSTEDEAKNLADSVAGSDDFLSGWVSWK